jgi:hypothetical protein
VFILNGLKVLCFDTLLQVLILKVDSGIAGALAQFPGLRILLQAVFLGNAGRKGVKWLAGYFMGYYTIWLAPVKRNFVPFRELEKRLGPLAELLGLEDRVICLVSGVVKGGEDVLALKKWVVL